MHVTLWTGVDSALVLAEVDAEGSRGSDGDAETALGVRGRGDNDQTPVIRRRTVC